jgi:hypothetical protein
MRRILSSLAQAAAVASVLAGLPFAAHADITATWDGLVGNWIDAQRWSTAPVFPNNSGADLFDAVVNAGSVLLSQDITINQFTLAGGAIDGASSLALAEGMQWSGGMLRGVGALNLGSASTSTISGGAQPLILNARPVNLSGSTTFSAGTIRGGFGAAIRNLTGSTFTALNNAAFFADSVSPGYTFDNAGTFIARSTTGAGFTSMDARFDNTGNVHIELAGTAFAHTLSLAGGGTHSGSFHLAADTRLELGGMTTLLAGATFTGGGTAIVAGDVAIQGNVTADHFAVAVGELSVGSSMLTAAISGTQTGGTVRLAAGGVLRVTGPSGNGTWNMEDGSLTGSGMLEGGLASQGEIAPGTGLGTLAVSGPAMFGSDARLRIELGGATTGTFDQLVIGGAATLDGELLVNFTEAFSPSFGQSFTILTGASVNGLFENAPIDNGRFDTADGLGSFEIDYTPNSVVLIGFIPEPSSFCFLTTAAGILASHRRRQRRESH